MEKPKKLGKKYYQAANGSEPAKEFLNSLDKTPRIRLFAQIDRLKDGNPGHGHGVGGVSELVIRDGPGYRIYYAYVEGQTIILLLTGGDKSTQADDIKKATEYFEDYEARAKESKNEKK